MKMKKPSDYLCVNPTAEAVIPMKENEAFELAKIVMKNQSIPQRLCKITGEPSHYLPWKESFQSVMYDIYYQCCCP